MSENDELHAIPLWPNPFLPGELPAVAPGDLKAERQLNALLGPIFDVGWPLVGDGEPKDALTYREAFPELNCDDRESPWRAPDA